MNIDTMTEREIDAVVAQHIFNCSVLHEKYATPINVNTIPRCDCLGANSASVRPHSDNVWGYIKHYSTDANATREMEAEIQRRGLEYDYCLALVEITEAHNYYVDNPGYLWALATASPADRCRAALRVVLGRDIM